MDGVAVGLSGAAVAVLLALVGLVLSVAHRVSKLESKFAAQGVKVDTMWGVVVEDALRGATSHGSVQRSSPYKPTEKGHRMFPDGLVEKAKSVVVECGCETQEDTALHLARVMKEEIIQIADENETTYQVALVTLVVLVGSEGSS